MNTQDALRLFRLNPPWVKQLWQYLRSEADILTAIPNLEGRKFSVWKAEHIIIEPALDLLKDLSLNISTYRNFKLEPKTRHATMLHRDHPSNPCFAVNVCIRGSCKVHFYDNLEPMFMQGSSEKEGTNPIYFTAGDPRETYVVNEGELFVMDTSAIHQADTSDCTTPVLLASFIPKPQYSYEDALESLWQRGIPLS